MFATYVFPIILMLVSVWLSIMWPVWRDNYRYRKETELLGEWHSSWFDPSNPDGWLSETVEFSVSNGEIVVRSKSNSQGYSWVGSGELYDRRYFYGTWKSTKPGSHSSGAFSFFILPQGDAAVGQAMGPDADGKILRFDWAIGKTPAALRAAQQWLVRLPSPKDTRERPPAQLSSSDQQIEPPPPVQ